MAPQPEAAYKKTFRRAGVITVLAGCLYGSAVVASELIDNPPPAACVADSQVVACRSAVAENDNHMAWAYGEALGAAAVGVSIMLTSGLLSKKVYDLTVSGLMNDAECLVRERTDELWPYPETPGDTF